MKDKDYNPKERKQKRRQKSKDKPLYRDFVEDNADYQINKEFKKKKQKFYEEEDDWEEWDRFYNK